MAHSVSDSKNHSDKITIRTSKQCGGVISYGAKLFIWLELELIPVFVFVDRV